MNFAAANPFTAAQDEECRYLMGLGIEDGPLGPGKTHLCSIIGAVLLENKQNNNDFVVETPLEVTLQFDTIAYSKGGAINKMLIHAMEEARWQNGMRKYLKDNQYGTVDGQIYFK